MKGKKKILPPGLTSLPKSLTPTFPRMTMTLNEVIDIHMLSVLYDEHGLILRVARRLKAPEEFIAWLEARRANIEPEGDP